MEDEIGLVRKRSTPVQVTDVRLIVVARERDAVLHPGPVTEGLHRAHTLVQMQAAHRGVRWRAQQGIVGRQPKESRGIHTRERTDRVRRGAVQAHAQGVERVPLLPVIAQCAESQGLCTRCIAAEVLSGTCDVVPSRVPKLRGRRAACYDRDRACHCSCLHGLRNCEEPALPHHHELLMPHRSIAPLHLQHIDPWWPISDGLRATSAEGELRHQPPPCIVHPSLTAGSCTIQL